MISPPSNTQPPSSAFRVALYARMSTDQQQYSIDNQVEGMRKYADQNGMEIVRTYVDEGKSGLTLDGRDAFQRLIDEVISGKADFQGILVYDVSRWGRFQDADESAYFEQVCKRAGVVVIFCAEPFENDGSPYSTIVKNLKRSMAGAYSRELSAKVFQGQCRLVQLGYHQGGLAGYGLRRLLISHTGEPKGELKNGEHKSIQTDRVILVPGPPEEVEMVRWIYQAFIEEKKEEREIAQILNGRGLLTDLSRPWNRATVHQILTNEKYIGNNVYNRMSFKLKMRRVQNPPEMWIRSNQAFTPVVDAETFSRAQEIIIARSRHLSDEELLDKLRALYQAHGCLSAIIIDEVEDGPSSAAYRSRFGSLLRAYRLVGYSPEHDYSYLEINRRLRELFPEVAKFIIQEIEKLGCAVSYDQDTGFIKVNDELTLLLVIARCQATVAGRLRWKIRMDHTQNVQITVAVRMDGSNSEILDYYLLPSLDMTIEKLRLAEYNGVFLDTYRFDSLEYLFEMVQRSKIQEVA